MRRVAFIAALARAKAAPGPRVGRPAKPDRVAR